MNKVLIVAELSANHNGSKAVAIETIRAAKRAGADAIKFQTYTPDTITINSDLPDFQIKQGTLWDGQTLYKLYQQAYTPWEWHRDLYEEAKKEDLICFSTPFDYSAVDFLETLGNPIYKIASFEITDIPLIRYVARLNKPVIISTGIADESDIALAIEACRNEGNDDITLLKCTSSYPAPVSQANLCMLDDMRSRFGVKVGLSDHSMGFVAPIVAVSFGVSVIEKHFIMDKKIGGVDSSFSLDEKEFAEMVRLVRDAESAIGKVSYKLSDAALKNRTFSRSLYVTKDINRGDIVTVENIRSVRPGFSLHPKYYDDILGKRANTDLKVGDRITLDMFY